MKSLIKTSLLVAGFLAFSGGTLFAGELEVKIPFAFVINGKTLPAGQYRVETDGAMVAIRGEKGTRGSAVAQTMTAIGHDPAGAVPALTFSRSENQVRLTGVWQSNSDGQAVIGR
jgi:hypothetical protein